MKRHTTRIMAGLLLAGGIIMAEDPAGTRAQKPGRPHVTMEEVFRRQGFIVEGRVLAMEEVTAPADVPYASGGNVLRVTLEVTRGWKGAARGDRLVVHTWPRGSAPCRGVSMQKDQGVLLWGSPSGPAAVNTFDWCGGFSPMDAVGTPSHLELLKGMFPSPR